MKKCFVLPALFSLLTVCHAAENTPQNSWKRFTILVWQYKTPAPSPQTKQLYESLHLHGIHLDNGFSDELLQFAKDNNYSYYVDHAAGKGDLYLKPEEWKTFVQKYRDDRSFPIRPRSIWDDEVRARLSKNLRDNITRAKNGPALAYAFDDEISLTSFTSPADVDWSPKALKRLRLWLQNQYGTLEKLNAQWHSKFQNWDDVLPKGVDDLRDFHAQPFSNWNLAPWLDHRRFMNEEWAALLTDLTRQANELDPKTPAGFVGGQAPSTYGGYDYALLADAVQWMEAYDIGGTNEILRSFWGQGKPHLQTYFLTENLAQDKWFLWYYLVHGNKGVIAWPDTDKGPWFSDGTARDSVKNLAPTFAEVQSEISEIFDNAHFQHDGIALYYSQPSIAVSWFMDSTAHGRTWVNRSSSMNNDNATDLLNRVAWTKLLEDSGFQYNFVSYRALQTQGAEALKNYRVLILPRTLALSQAEATAIKQWTEGGGILIADYLPGTFDEHGKARARGALDDVFGVARDSTAGVLDGNAIAEVNAEKYEQPLSERFSYDGARRDADNFVLYERALRPLNNAKAKQIIEGAACNIENQFGKGAARYLNWTPLPYLLLRNTPQGAIYRSRLNLPIKSRVEISSENRALPLCERLFWDKNGKHYLCLIMNPTRAAKIDGAGSLGSEVTDTNLKINLQFQGAISNLKNERTGRVLGKGNTFSDTWNASEANIYSFESK